MLENWDNVIITDVKFAVYVHPESGKVIHNNRPYHGFVINDTDAYKKIHFSDGTTLKVGSYCLHYLPKNSNYRVETINPGGCWAINFDLLKDINEKPFSISFRSNESILKNFKKSVSAWEKKTEFHNIIIKKNLYEIILKIREEQQRNYVPSAKEMLLQPAIDTINCDFTSNSISVKYLAELCKISEPYFRRCFYDIFSATPKEYIINLRIEYAKRLLLSRQFSVNQIAEMCGYSEPCHFSREFSKHTGLSPNTYKKYY